MRVTLVADEYPGSSDRFVVEEAAAFAGHEISVLTRRRSAPQLYTPLDVPVRALPDEQAGAWPRAVRTATAAASLARSAPRHPGRVVRLVADRGAGRARLHYHAVVGQAPQRIHFESPTLALKLATVARLGVPYAVRVSPADLPRLTLLDPRARERLTALLAGASQTYAISPDTADAFAARIGNGSAPCIVPRVAEPAPRARSASDGLIVVDGPADYHAGLEYTLMALARLAVSGVAWRARVVGRGPMWRYLVYTAASLGLRDRVEWLEPGDLDVCDREIAAATAVVTSAVSDRLTRATWTALGAGVPVIAPSAAGFAPRDVDALAAELSRQLAHDDPSARDAARDRLLGRTVAWSEFVAGGR